MAELRYHDVLKICEVGQAGRQSDRFKVKSYIHVDSNLIRHAHINEIFKTFTRH